MKKKPKQKTIWKTVRLSSLERDNQRCIICGATPEQLLATGKKKYLNVHHLIDWGNKATRFELNNLVTLCPNHHAFDYKISAHNSGIAFAEWLRHNRPQQYQWVLEHS